MAKFNPLDHPISFEYPHRIVPSAWLSHIPFAMYLVDILRPNVFVELGTHSGVSYCAFCQAVKTLNLDTRCYAIDTWEGDPHSGHYGLDVLNDLREHHDPLYAGFSRLMKSAFDDALPHFDDSSIDLLHLDGYHTYENVKHDLDAWLPKISKTGVLLLHDTNAREQDFGAHRVWDEIKSDYPHFEFIHGHGLGMLGVGEKTPKELGVFFSASDQEGNRIRTFFFGLGRLFDEKVDYELAMSQLREHLTKELHKRDQRIAELDGMLRTASASREREQEQIEGLKVEISTLRDLIREMEERLNLLNTEYEEAQQALQDLTAQLDEKDTRISALNAQVEKTREEAKNLELNIEQKAHRVTVLENEVQEIDRRISLLQSQKVVDDHHRSMEILASQRQISARDAKIDALENRIEEFLGSTSWRMTDPFRRFMVRVRSLLKPGSPEHTGVIAALQEPSPRATPQISPGTDLVHSPSASVDKMIRERFPSLQPIRGFQTPYAERRLNVVTDSINTGSLFGGVATSLILSALLADQMDCELRIITCRESALKQNFEQILAVNNIPWKRNVEFLFVDVMNQETEFPVGKRDLFLTTSWWTTASVLGSFNANRVLYLIQEDERTFYPFSDDYQRCVEILSHPELKFIVNSELLYDHFINEGFDNISRNGHWFEPAFSEGLFYREKESTDRKQRFFYYARMNHLRNLFYLGLEVVESSVTRGYLNPNQWELYFVGADIPDVLINSTIRPVMIKNIPWSEYASIIRDTDLGLSLMYSPHPSYPPLDLASSGAVVVTNRYGNKQSLDQYSKNIICKALNFDDLLLGIKEGVDLALNEQMRNHNYQENRICRSWHEAFAPVLDSLADWGKDVPA